MLEKNHPLGSSVSWKREAYKELYFPVTEGELLYIVLQNSYMGSPYKLSTENLKFSRIAAYLTFYKLRQLDLQRNL